MSKHSKNYQEPTHEEIAACAQQIYEKEGRPQGKALEHWLQAESQLTAERKAAKSTPKPAVAQVNAPRGNSWQGSRQNLHAN